MDVPEPYTSRPTLLALDGDSVVAAICAGWSYYVTDQEILVLDRRTGHLAAVWPVIGGRLVGVSDGVLVISARDGVIGVSVAERRELWRITPENGRLPDPFAVDHGVAAFLRYDEKYQSFLDVRSVKDASLLWETPAGDLSAFCISPNGRLFAIRSVAGQPQGSLLAFNVRTGETVWELGLDMSNISPSSLRLEVQDGRAYLYSLYDEAGVTAFDIDAHLRMWTSGVGLRIQSLRQTAGLVFYLGTKDSRSELYAAKSDSGEILWSGFPQVGEMTWSGVPRSGLLLGPTSDGALFLGALQPGVSRSDAVVIVLQER
jgi:outer membrane protein assembly factor BamB